MAYLRILKGTDEHKSVEFTESEDSLYVQPVLELDFKREFGDEIILQENVVEVLAVPLKIRKNFNNIYFPSYNSIFSYQVFVLHRKLDTFNYYSVLLNNKLSTHKR